MTTTAGDVTRARDIEDDVIDRYRRDGFVHIPRVFDDADVAEFREAALAAQTRLHNNATGQAERVFAQLLQVWQQDDPLRRLTLDENLAAIATRLAGIPLRLWHDQLLIKAPHNGARTEFHQDGPFWPHAGSRHSLSAWVALVDVPVSKGCMTFIPGSHHNIELRAQNLLDREDLFTVAPELRWEPRVTIPLRAGDCTFHNAYTAHSANANESDAPRIAHVVIYMDREATLTAGPSHVLIDDFGYEMGKTPPDGQFPPVG